MRLTGGHLKHSHYFEHVRRIPGFAPRITFGGEAPNDSQVRERRRLWPTGDNGTAARWEPSRRDVLFLAGVDWRYLANSGPEGRENPRVNLIQHVRHAYEGTELYRYLAGKAIRICVSQEVADAIADTGRANGPILTIPNGTDITPVDTVQEGSPEACKAQRQPITIIGYKSPDLARALSERLTERTAHRLVTEFLDRCTFLDRLVDSRIVVCLPRPEEGFYLPALEAMALGCLVVTLDCIGNRSFCHHDENCLIAESNPDSLFEATKRMLDMSAPECDRLLRRARDTATAHSLNAERTRFHAILGDVDQLWRMG